MAASSIVEAVFDVEYLRIYVHIDFLEKDLQSPRIATLALHQLWKKSIAYAGMEAGRNVFL